MHALANVDALSLMEEAYFDRKDGRLDEALSKFRAAIAAGAVDRRLHSAYLCTLLHDSAHTVASLREEHDHWNALFCNELVKVMPHANGGDPYKRLRIGYLSGEYTCSPPYFFLKPVLAHHDRRQVQVLCYDIADNPDACTPSFAKYADLWRVCRGLAPEHVADHIRRDQVDILIDACGHFFSDGLPVHTFRPAPVSIAFPNYPFTTGLSSIDYLITDHWLSPAGVEAAYAERLIRLPSGFLVFDPPEDSPSIDSAPFSKNGHVTFGIFQRPLKYNSGFWDTLGDILSGLPTSRLLVHFGVRDLETPDGDIRVRIDRELATRGVCPTRVDFRGLRSVRDHLALVSSVDIALDTFPYNGQITTCECFWMGVPVISLRGESHVSRIGQALLERVSLGSLSAANTSEYREIAVRLARDLPRLAGIRAELRERVRSSGLADPRAYCSQLESAYRSVWTKWALTTNEFAAQEN